MQIKIKGRLGPPFFDRRLNMLVTEIVKRVNSKLAGEMLAYSELEMFLDDAVDDINTHLSANFPVFSDMPEGKLEYDYMPDKYVRSVIVTGAALKFYITDEEGSPAALKYEQQYLTNLYYMLRDYSIFIPEEYLADSEQGALYHPDDSGIWLEHSLSGNTQHSSQGCDFPDIGSVAVTKLEAEDDPTVAAEDTDGGIAFAFGIPTGDEDLDGGEF